MEQEPIVRRIDGVKQPLNLLVHPSLVRVDHKGNPRWHAVLWVVCFGVVGRRLLALLADRREVRHQLVFFKLAPRFRVLGLAPG